MRELIGRRFDVLVVIWVLALAMGFSLVSIARTEPTGTEWTTPVTHQGAIWDYSAPDAN